MIPELETRPVLGTEVHCADYDSGLRAAISLLESGRPCAVAAANTHLVSLARSDRGFARVMGKFQLILPDGVPLVWEMNARGACLADRVYGPYFMRHVLARAPRPYRHFFFGGSPECLRALEAAALKLQPDLEVAGRLSPPYREWSEEDEEGFARAIAGSGADFIWVALGGGRQERWIADNLHRHTRGVFIAVGDAFELLAGSRPFAPAWMQRHGLTWLYRLCQDPVRLWPRYLRFNSLFLFYGIRDRLLGSPPPPGIGGKPSIAFLGSRGVPANYSGFEVVVEELGSRLLARGHPVTVYNRYPHFRRGGSRYRGMRVLTLPTIPTKSLDTITHTALSSLDALFRRYDVVYLCGVGNALLAGIIRLSGARVIINVDGADFRRSKWGTLGRWWLKHSERWATKLADALIADNPEIVARYRGEYGVQLTYLSYGAELRDRPVRVGELARWGLEAGRYLLFVARLTPENEADLLLRAYARSGCVLPLVICGSTNYERRYNAQLRGMAGEGVIFTGPRFGDAYIELSQNALFFVLPSAIEATRLVLLDQMGMGKAVLYKDCPATREVIGDAGEAFSPDDAVNALAAGIAGLVADPDRCAELGRRARRRAEEKFNWERVTDRYEEIIDASLPQHAGGRAPR